MTTKTVCNICGKDIGIRWFELRNIHKEIENIFIFSKDQLRNYLVGKKQRYKKNDGII